MNATSEMKTRIHLGPVPAIALRPDLIVACEHVARPFRAATITTESGVPYHEEFIWEDRNGAQESVRACDFAFSAVINHMEDDILYCRPWRPVFAECIVELQPVVMDDGVWLEHKRLGWISSYVVAFRNDSPRWPIIRYRAESQDSGTLVWSSDRTRVVGFVSGSDARGAVVRSPNLAYQFPAAAVVEQTSTVADLNPAPVPDPVPDYPAPALQMPEMSARAARIAGPFEALMRAIVENCPENRARSVAITQLETGFLWAEASIISPKIPSPK